MYFEDNNVLIVTLYHRALTFVSGKQLTRANEIEFGQSFIVLKLCKYM